MPMAKKNKVAPVSQTERTILDMVMPRLWPNGNSDPFLVLEVTEGPYKGVVFAFSKFEVSTKKIKDGMVATKFETKQYVTPKGFRADEAWDLWAGEFLLAWLHYLSLHEFGTLANAETDGQVH
jgi:hypothetical protein